MKASPVEHELVCPKGHHVELRDGLLHCDGSHGPDDGCTWERRQLVRAERTRLRQFTHGFAKAARSGVWPDMATREKWMVAFL